MNPVDNNNNKRPKIFKRPHIPQQQPGANLNNNTDTASQMPTLKTDLFERRNNSKDNQVSFTGGRDGQNDLRHRNPHSQAKIKPPQPKKTAQTAPPPFVYRPPQQTLGPPPQPALPGTFIRPKKPLGAKKLTPAEVQQIEQRAEEEKQQKINEVKLQKKQALDQEIYALCQKLHRRKLKAIFNKTHRLSPTSPESPSNTKAMANGLLEKAGKLEFEDRARLYLYSKGGQAEPLAVRLPNPNNETLKLKVSPRNNKVYFNLSNQKLTSQTPDSGSVAFFENLEGKLTDQSIKNMKTLKQKLNNGENNTLELYPPEVQNNEKLTDFAKKMDSLSAALSNYQKKYGEQLSDQNKEEVTKCLLAFNEYRNLLYLAPNLFELDMIYKQGEATVSEVAENLQINQLMPGATSIFKKPTFQYQFKNFINACNKYCQDANETLPDITPPPGMSVKKFHAKLNNLTKWDEVAKFAETIEKRRTLIKVNPNLDEKSLQTQTKKYLYQAALEIPMLKEELSKIKDLLTKHNLNSVAEIEKFLTENKEESFDILNKASEKDFKTNPYLKPMEKDYQKITLIKKAAKLIEQLEQKENGLAAINMLEKTKHDLEKGLTDIGTGDRIKRGKNFIRNIPGFYKGAKTFSVISENLPYGKKFLIPTTKSLVESFGIVGKTFITKPLYNLYKLKDANCVGMASEELKDWESSLPNPHTGIDQSLEKTLTPLAEDISSINGWLLQQLKSGQNLGSGDTQRKIRQTYSKMLQVALNDQPIDTNKDYGYELQKLRLTNTNSTNKQPFNFINIYSELGDLRSSTLPKLIHDRRGFFERSQNQIEYLQLKTKELAEAYVRMFNNQIPEEDLKNFISLAFNDDKYQNVNEINQAIANLNISGGHAVLVLLTYVYKGLEVFSDNKLLYLLNLRVNKNIIGTGLQQEADIRGSDKPAVSGAQV